MDLLFSISYLLKVKQEKLVVIGIKSSSSLFFFTTIHFQAAGLLFQQRRMSNLDGRFLSAVSVEKGRNLKIIRMRVLFLKYLKEPKKSDLIM